MEGPGGLQTADWLQHPVPELEQLDYGPFLWNFLGLRGKEGS